MSQFRGFSASFINDKIRATWVVSVGSISSGPYVSQEVISWTGGGAGVYLSDSNGTFRLFRTSGGDPIGGDLITGATSGASCTISLVPTTDSEGLDINPPRFLSSPAQGAVVVDDLFLGDTALLSTSIRKVLTIDAEDHITLAETGSTHYDIPCYITRDFTPNLTIPLPGAGDGRIGTQLREAFNKIDVLDIVGAWKTVAVDASVDYSTNWQDKAGAQVRWRAEHGRVIMDGIAEKTTGLAVPEDIFTLPVGFRPGYTGMFAVGNSNEVQITAAGVVSMETGTVDEVNFSQIAFVAEN